MDSKCKFVNYLQIEGNFFIEAAENQESMIKLGNGSVKETKMEWPEEVRGKRTFWESSESVPEGGWQTLKHVRCQSKIRKFS